MAWFDTYPVLAADGMPQNLNTCTDFKHNRSYVCWVSNAGEIKIGQYNHHSNVWSTFVLNSGATVDNHVIPAVLVLESGIILVCYFTSQFSGTIFRRLSSNPNDISSWGAETSIDLDANGFVYPKLIQLTGESGRIYLFWRARNGDAARIEKFSTSDDGGVTWSAATSMFSNTDHKPYFYCVKNGSNRIDFVATAGHPAELSTNSIYHFYYDGTWRKSDGTAVSLPLTPSDVAQVYSGATNRAGQAVSIATDSTEKPRILFVQGISSGTDLRYMHGRWNGSSWDVNEIATAGGAHFSADPWNPGGMCFDDGNPNAVFLSREVSSGQWEIQKYITTDNGATWAKDSDITSGSTKPHNIWPTTIRNPNTTFRTVWSYGTFLSVTSWQSTLYGNPDLRGLMPTRFYCPNSVTVPQSVGFDSGWTDTDSCHRHMLVTSKTAEEVLALGLRQSWAAPNSMSLDHQFVSSEVDSQFINGTIQCYIQAREFNNADNSVTRFGARVITGSGTTRGVLLAASAWGSNLELINNATLRSAAVCSQTSINSVTAGRGDRIVIEVGFSDLNGSTPEGQYRYGAPISVEDIPVNETTTASGVGWIQFSKNIVFVSSSSNAVPLILRRLSVN